MSLSFISIIYEDDHNCVSWSGLQCADNQHFSDFLTSKVANRLDDSEGNAEFSNHLNGLGLTGLSQKNLATALELTVLDLIMEQFDDDAKLNLMRECATDAFHLLQVLPLPEDPVRASYQSLRMATLAVLGNRGADISRILEQEVNWPTLALDSTDWGERTRATIADVWLRLIRNKGWEDRAAVVQRVADLRKQQNQYEKSYLDNIDPAYAKAAALELLIILRRSKTMRNEL